MEDSLDARDLEGGKMGALNSSVIKACDLKKKYPDFLMDHISFNIAKGTIVGLVGENGAGKSTLLKLLLNLIPLDQGDVYIFGKKIDTYNGPDFSKIGVVLDENFLPGKITSEKLNDVMKRIYKDWDEQLYFKYLNRFNIPVNKIIDHFSKGMKMKLAIIVSMSHKLKLLILDEPTTGLDPIVREEIIDLFNEINEVYHVTIIFSSHITADIEKIADDIMFLNKGKIELYDKKDWILGQFVIAKCKNKYDLEEIKKNILYYKKKKDGYYCLLKRDCLSTNLSIDVCESSLDEIMSFHIKGEKLI